MLDIVPRKYILRRCYIILVKSEREGGETMLNYKREVKFINIKDQRTRLKNPEIHQYYGRL